MRVFADTSAFVPLYHEKDPHAQAALAVSQQMVERGDDVFTSNYVIAETLTVLSQRAGKAAALSFGQEVRNGDLVVIRVTEDVEGHAFERFRTTQKDVSFVDCTSFVICENLGIRDVFAFDRHFTRYGFKLLEPSPRG